MSTANANTKNSAAQRRKRLYRERLELDRAVATGFLFTGATSYIDAGRGTAARTGADGGRIEAAATFGTFTEELLPTESPGADVGRGIKAGSTL